MSVFLIFCDIKCGTVESSEWIKRNIFLNYCDKSEKSWRKMKFCCLYILSNGEKALKFSWIYFSTRLFAKISDVEKGHEIFLHSFFYQIRSKKSAKEKKIQFSWIYFSTKLEAKISARAKKKKTVSWIYLSTKLEAKINIRAKKKEIFLNLFFYQIGSKNQH